MGRPRSFDRQLGEAIHTLIGLAIIAGLVMIYLVIPIYQEVIRNLQSITKFLIWLALAIVCLGLLAACAEAVKRVGRTQSSNITVRRLKMAVYFGLIMDFILCVACLALAIGSA